MSRHVKKSRCDTPQNLRLFTVPGAFVLRGASRALVTVRVPKIPAIFIFRRQLLLLLLTLLVVFVFRRGLLLFLLLLFSFPVVFGMIASA
jgi:hypothetical protein